MWSAIAGIIGSVLGGVKQHFEHKRQIEEAKVKAKIERLQSKQRHTQRWEILQLENNGWQDNLLFYFFIGLFVWAGIDPAGAQEFFQNLQILPDWFVKTWMWIVASVIGVKKIGDYGPRLIESTYNSLKVNKDTGLVDNVVEGAKNIADNFTGEGDQSSESEKE